MPLVRLRGAEILPYLDRIARLRIEVFAEWPYLYDGSLAYESRYLRQYAEASTSFAALYVDASEEVLGASTAVRLDEADAVFGEALAGWGPASSICYFGESVLRASARGRGVGHAFFDAREEHARTLGCDRATFCAVERPDEHPARPDDYRPLDAFWARRGYARHGETRVELAWKDLGEAEERVKSLRFWSRRLGEIGEGG